MILLPNERSVWGGVRGGGERLALHIFPNDFLIARPAQKTIKIQRLFFH